MSPFSNPESARQEPPARMLDAPAEYPRPAYAWYVVSVLTLAYMFSFLDRQILSFMIKPIKEDFALSNFEVGLLHGTTFAVFYTLFGLPVGRWADTRIRQGLIAVGFVVWSLMTAASGLAQKFWHLLLCRTGVAVGEATLSLAGVSYPLATSGAWAAASLLPLVVGFSAPFGVVAAAIQSLAPAPMRAQAPALFLFVINLLGLGLGPAATGWLTDLLSSDSQGQSLHVALLIALVTGSICALVIFALGLQPYRRTAEAIAAANGAAIP